MVLVIYRNGACHLLKWQMPILSMVLVVFIIGLKSNEEPLVKERLFVGTYYFTFLGYDR